MIYSVLFCVIIVMKLSILVLCLAFALSFGKFSLSLGFYITFQVHSTQLMLYLSFHSNCCGPIRFRINSQSFNGMVSPSSTK